MNKISFPSPISLKWWVEDLQGEDPLLKLSLPRVNDEWYERVLGILDMVQMPYYQCSTHKMAAIIFYKIVKAHNYIDGNKRSGVIVVYLFYLINGYYVSSSLDLEGIAKKVASSRGRNNYDKWIYKIEDLFSNHVYFIDNLG